MVMPPKFVDEPSIGSLSFHEFRTHSFFQLEIPRLPLPLLRFDNPVQ